MRKIQTRLRTQQQGLSLLLVLVLLVISISTSLFFHQRMVSSTRISGATRDNSESLMLAESAMERLRGGFINNFPLSTTATPFPLYALESRDCTWNAALGVFEGQDAAVCELAPLPDAGRAAGIGGKMGDTTALETALTDAVVDYMFYVGAADQILPNILQRVANAGAGVTGSTCAATGTHAVAANCNELPINTLFVDGSPLLFTTNANGRLIGSNAANWQAELDAVGNNGTVAAAWLELTVNETDPDAVDTWVQAMASVGIATSYVQRYTGTYHPGTNILGSLAGLVEASNIDREITP